MPRRGCHHRVQVVSILLFKDMIETVMGSGKWRMRKKEDRSPQLPFFCRSNEV